MSEIVNLQWHTTFKCLFYVFILLSVGSLNISKIADNKPKPTRMIYDYFPNWITNILTVVSILSLNRPFYGNLEAPLPKVVSLNSAEGSTYYCWMDVGKTADDTSAPNLVIKAAK